MMGKVEREIQQDSTKRNFKKEKTKPSVNRKEGKETLEQKRARLIVRNLPFTATEKNIRKHFEKYGKILNIDLLKKLDGKLVGCAFVQFQLVQFAKQAQYYTNNQGFLGRNIQVDFAKPKDKYKKEKKELNNVKHETKSEVNIKQDENNEDNVEINEESHTYDPQKDNTYSDEDLYMEADPDSDTDNVPLDRRSHKVEPYQSHDIAEGKTIFIKNVPFQATNDDVKHCMLQFGPIYYALVCVNKLTEYSKGTAFVKFVNKEDANKALSAGTELTLLGNVLDCHPAVDQDELKNKLQAARDVSSKPKDFRNLYLVKEGVIFAGTKAAESVSASDMEKRLQIEQYKTQMLRNLNMFVSRERLVVHNLPPTWDDRRLNMLMKKYGGKEAVVKEARIMRNMKKVDAKGVGESKQYGFVTFTEHENALTALRSLNNNPSIFSPHRRPIITFSIENKSALRAKIKRQEKSRFKNPKAKDFNSSLSKKGGEEQKLDAGVESFAGVTAKAGTVQKLRNRHKLTEQRKLHYENIKKDKRKQNILRKTLIQRKKDFTKQPKQKINKKNQEDNFSSLVNDYKKKLMGDISVKKSKWYK